MPVAVPAQTPKRWNLLQRLIENPVIMKELRGRMRGRQAFILLTAYLGLNSLVIGLLYISLARETPFAAWDPNFRQGIGKAVFGTVVLLELFLVSFIGPALTSGAITSERERQTFDLLRTTTLTARSFVLGKLGASLAYLLLLIFTALPIESIAFLLGGVGLEEIAVSSLMLVVTAVFFCTLGMFFSSFMKRTLGATVSSYATIVLSFIVLAVAFFMLTYVTAASSAPSGYQSNNSLEVFITIILWILISTNPLLAAIISEVILVDDQSLFLTSTPLGNQGIALPSPWIPFVLIYLSLTVLMIHLSIRFVRRPDR